MSSRPLYPEDTTQAPPSRHSPPPVFAAPRHSTATLSNATESASWRLTGGHHKSGLEGFLTHSDASWKENGVWRDTHCFPVHVCGLYSREHEAQLPGSKVDDGEEDKKLQRARAASLKIRTERRVSMRSRAEERRRRRLEQIRRHLWAPAE